MKCFFWGEGAADSTDLYYIIIYSMSHIFSYLLLALLSCVSYLIPHNINAPAIFLPTHISHSIAFIFVLHEAASA